MIHLELVTWSAVPTVVPEMHTVATSLTRKSQMQRLSLIVGLVAVAAVTSTAEAQRRDHGDDIPPGHRPPPGMCRLWIDGLAPGLQPKPTDCDTAERQAGENTRIIYGDRTPFPGNGNGKWKKGKKDKNRDRWCDDNDLRDQRDCRVRDRDEDEDTDEDTDEDRKDRNRDRDGVWDRSRYPDRLPEMRNAILYQRGQRPKEVRRWLGERDLRLRITDEDNNGRPERVVWLNQRGQTLQVWIDRNRDGRADRVEFYNDGKRVRVIQ